MHNLTQERYEIAADQRREMERPLCAPTATTAQQIALVETNSAQARMMIAEGRQVSSARRLIADNDRRLAELRAWRRAARRCQSLAAEVAADIRWPDDGTQIEQAWRDLSQTEHRAFGNRFDDFAAAVEAVAEGIEL